MRRKFIVLVLIGILFGWNGWGMMVASPPGEPARISFQRYETEGPALGLVYSIPYGGMVEVRIFDAEGSMIWRNQYVREKGEHRLNLKKTVFEPGQSYSIQMNYKQDEILRELPLR